MPFGNADKNMSFDFPHERRKLLDNCSQNGSSSSGNVQSNALALAADYFVNKNLFSFLSAGNSNFRLRNLKPSLNNTKFTPLWPVQTCKSHQVVFTQQDRKYCIYFILRSVLEGYNQSSLVTILGMKVFQPMRTCVNYDQHIWSKEWMIVKKEYGLTSGCHMNKNLGKFSISVLYFLM